MKRIGLICAMVFLALVGTSQEGFKRVALVVGNSEYRSAPLVNPVNDATDVSALLASQGFEVTKLINSDRRQMLDGIRAFGDQLDNRTIALFYYAGHAVQLEGQNFLIPVNAPIQRESDVEFEGVSIDRVIQSMEDSDAYMNLVFLDACRDNPFLSSSRSASRGLSVVAVDVQPQSAGAMIAFATAPGSTAADGEGRNGVFTQAFLKYAAQPGLEINQMLLQVRREVIRSTDGIQIPWTDISLIEEFYFNPTQPSSGNNTLTEDTEAQVNPTSEVIATNVSPLPLTSENPEEQYSPSILSWSLMGSGAGMLATSLIYYFSTTEDYESYQQAADPLVIQDLRNRMDINGGVVVSLAVSGVVTGILGLFIDDILEMW